MSEIDQAGRSTAMKPFSYTAHAAQEQRPRGRAGSNTSTSSATTTASTKSHDQFVFSPHQTPASEKDPFFSHQEFSSLHHPQTHNIPSQKHSTNTSQFSSETTYSATPHSRPIVIELPSSSVPKKSNTDPTYTPIPPLSARGDISGGYFPFHEDPEDRIHRPHPFHTAEKEARRDCNVNSSARSIESIHGAHPSSATGRPASPGPTPVSAPPGHFPMLQAAKMPSSRSHTPVTSYVPSGLHETPLPVGKYYPSNYEQRQKQSHHSSASSTRRPSAIGPSSVKSDTVVPQINRVDPRGRPDSEAKMRLLQYQRDMITQAQLAKQRLEVGSSSPSAAGHHSARMPKTASSRGPISPRLQPLGSPGPVTPLALEGADGYLSARSRVSPRDRSRPVPSPDAGRENHAVARAMKAHSERRRREGRCSPAVEAGGFGF